MNESNSNIRTASVITVEGTSRGEKGNILAAAKGEMLSNTVETHSSDTGKSGN